MNANDILDAIGEADDAAVKRAKQKKRRSFRYIPIAAGAAACLTLVLAIPVIRQELVPDRAEEEYHYLLESHEELVESMADMVEIAPEYMAFDIWYVDGDQLVSESREFDSTSENKFLAWKELNGIGEDVRFISVKVEDNGYDSYSDDGMTVTHVGGDHHIYYLTVSKELEAYYDTTDKALLLDSLQKTMTGGSHLEYDEYHLILE